MPKGSRPAARTQAPARPHARTHRIASTTTILKSSAMSLMKPLICLSSLSTLPSFPVLSSVVMASVAIERFWSVIRLSMSMLQLVTAMGCVIATCSG